MTTTVDAVASGTERLIARAAIEDWLYDESAALDEGRYMEWLDLVSDDFLYTVPLPIPREDPAAPQYHDFALLASGSKGAFDLRIRRVGFSSAWGDRPRPYMRHHVSNIRSSPGDGPDQWNVKSNVVVVRARGELQPILLSAGRVDVLRGAPESGFELARRVVYVDSEAPSHASLLLPI